MTEVMLSLSTSLNEWAKKQAANNNFGSISEYVENLLREERERQEAIEEFDRLVQEGEDSGIGERTMDEILEDARRQARQRLTSDPSPYEKRPLPR